MMLTVLLVPILFAFQPLLQNPSAAGDNSPVVATYFRWFKDRQAAEKAVMPARVPQQPTIEPNNSIGRKQREDGKAPERDPNLDKLETRSASLDRIAEESSETPRVDGFTYEVKFKNLETKQAKTVFWEYQFKDSANTENTSHRRFVCGVKIKPGKDELVQVFSTIGPFSVIDLKSLKEGSGRQFDESIIIDRIEYEDGSVWQRKGWNFDEAKFTVTTRDRSRVCRSF